MIKPTIGRVVWFYEPFMPDVPEQAQAAIVTYVHSDTLVNLCVLDRNGIPHGRTSITLRQPEVIAPTGCFCEWMPFQVATAAKTETLSSTPTAAADQTYEAVCASWHAAQLSMSRMPWRTAVEILSVVKKLPAEEREKLLALDDATPST